MKNNVGFRGGLAIGLLACIGAFVTGAHARTDITFGIAVPGLVVQAGQPYGPEFRAYPSYPSYPAYAAQPGPFYQSNPFPPPLYSNVPVPPQVGYGSPYYPSVYAAPPVPVYVTPPPVYYNRGYYQRNYYDAGRHGYHGYRDWR